MNRSRFHVVSRCALVRRAFTLVELLVVIGVVSILIALTLAGISSVRATTMNVGCQNNLRQIGTAVQVFHDARSYFPPGGVEHRSLAAPTGRQLAWNVFLLPYLEQESLFKTINTMQAFDSTTNSAAAATVVSTFLCPLSGRTSPLLQGRAVSDYGGVRGENILGPNPRKSGDVPNGVMVYDNDRYPAPPMPIHIRRYDVKDGLDLTIIIAEDTQTRDGQWINDANVFDQGYAINKAQIQYANVGERENDMFSNHRGGAHALFCDGRVKLLSEDLDTKILAALCTRASHEIVNDDSF